MASQIQSCGVKPRLCPQPRADAVVAIIGMAARLRDGRGQKYQPLRRGVPGAPIFAQLPLAQQQHLGPAARREHGTFKAMICAIARQQKQIGKPLHPRSYRGVGAVLHVGMAKPIEADHKIEILQRERALNYGGEFLLHAVIGALPHRQHGDRKIGREIARIPRSRIPR